jgi:hypothetical protein
MRIGSAVRRRINRYALADCARSSSAARRSSCAPMPRSGRRPCPNSGPSAASKRAHEPCPAQMLWAPLPLSAVAPNDVLRLASASTAPIARPVRPQQRRMQLTPAVGCALRLQSRHTPARLSRCHLGAHHAEPRRGGQAHRRNYEMPEIPDFLTEGCAREPMS